MFLLFIRTFFEEFSFFHMLLYSKFRNKSVIFFGGTTSIVTRKVIFDKNVNGLSLGFQLVFILRSFVFRSLGHFLDTHRAQYPYVLDF